MNFEERPDLCANTSYNENTMEYSIVLRLDKISDALALKRLAENIKDFRKDDPEPNMECLDSKETAYREWYLKAYRECVVEVFKSHMEDEFRPMLLNFIQKLIPDITHKFYWEQPLIDDPADEEAGTSTEERNNLRSGWEATLDQERRRIAKNPAAKVPSIAPIGRAKRTPEERDEEYKKIRENFECKTRGVLRQLTKKPTLEQLFTHLNLGKNHDRETYRKAFKCVGDKLRDVVTKLWSEKNKKSHRDFSP
jgi:hypothetical protein